MWTVHRRCWTASTACGPSHPTVTAVSWSTWTVRRAPTWSPRWSGPASASTAWYRGDGSRTRSSLWSAAIPREAGREHLLDGDRAAPAGEPPTDEDHPRAD